jgi:hypothetical protein
MIERPSRRSASHTLDSGNADTALYLIADGRCLRRNVVQAHDPDAIAFKHVYESRDGAWYKSRLKFAPLVSRAPLFHPFSENDTRKVWTRQSTHCPGAQSMTESVSGETRGSTGLDRVGTVEIVFWQGRCRGEIPGPPGPAEDKLDFGPVDELSKKVRSSMPLMRCA